VADALDLDTLKRAMEGIHSAFYLIHSMLFGRQRFESLDILAASKFRKAAEEKKIPSDFDIQERIDHIFVSQGTSVSFVEYLTQPESDHTGLYVEILP